MLRLARISIVFLLMLPLNATSLGLGDINLRSALNQPLEARIELTALGQTSIEDISVRLASREAFAQVGLERPLFLDDLRFAVERDERGQAAVRISSRQPLTEPFLDFLVEINWPNGRLLREYTALLDPPLLLDEAPAPVVAPSAGLAAQTVQTTTSRPQAQAPQAQATARTPAARPAPQVQQGADGSWSYGSVARDATLWSIAQELRSLDNSYSVEQIMMALLRDNPEAFYNNNVNELKAGYVLRIDDPAMIGAMSHAAAVAETRRQAQQWMDAKRGFAELAADRPQGAEGAQAMVGAGRAPAAASSGPRLRLSAPDAADADRITAGTVEGESESGTAQRLRQELAEALEVSESARQENVELRERLAALEEQIASMQRLLTLQGDTLTALQTDGVDADAAQQPAAAASGERSVAAEPEPAAARDNPFATLLNDPMMLGVGGVALLLLATLGWLVARRRQIARASLDEFTVQGPLTGRQQPVTAVAAGAAAGGAAAAGMAVEELDDTVASTTEDSGADIMQADEDEIDVLAEADVYLAYRRFDKAEELLKEAIKADPDRRDLVFKLLEVYGVSGDADAFTLQAESLHTALDGSDAPMWDKVEAMGRRLAPEHPLFAAALLGAAAPVGAAGDVDELDLSGLDLDGFDPEEGATAESVFNEGDVALSDAAVTDLDFTLDTETASAEDYPAFRVDSADAPEDDVSIVAEMPADGAFEADALADVSAEPAPAGFEGAAGTVAAAVEEEGYAGSLSDMAAEPSYVAAAGDAPEQEQGAEAEDLSELDLNGDFDWLAAVGEDLATFESDGAEEGDEFGDLISGNDEIDTKLDLAKAYIDMGDQESARSILSEVSEEGSEDQQREASDLMRQIG